MHEHVQSPCTQAIDKGAQRIEIDTLEILVPVAERAMELFDAGNRIRRGTSQRDRGADTMREHVGFGRLRSDPEAIVDLREDQ
ncbi:hypothetical protein MJS38_28345, partial [Burkholderia gladioli]